MGLFNFGKKKEQPTEPVSPSGGISRPEIRNFEDLLARHAAFSFEKQLLFGELIGSRNWQFDMGAGQISFGDDLSFDVQLIGTLAFGNMSWLWGWGNEQSGIPAPLLQDSLALKAYGEQNGMEELSTRSLEVYEGFEHAAGMIACGYTGSRAYYCANYGQGTLVVTLKDPQIPAPDPDNLGPVLLRFPQLIQAVEVDHRKALIHYLIDRKCTVAESGDEVIGTLGDTRLTGTFDDQGRLTHLSLG